MNQEQKKYFLKRVSQVAQEKIESPNVDIAPFLKKLIMRNHRSFIQKINYRKVLLAVVNNCFKEKRLPNDNEYSSPMRIPEIYFFENFEEVMNNYKDECNRVSNIVREKNAKINKYANELGDKLVLGNASEALKGLEKFQSMKF